MMGNWWQRWRARRVPADLDLPGLFSQAALQRAWLQVRHNGGAAGTDQVTIRAFEQQLERNLTELQGQLVAGSYQPQRVTQVHVPRPDGRTRPIAVWTVRDRIVQRLIHEYLEPIYEPLFLECSFGFRPNRGVRDAIRAVEQLRDDNRRWVVESDIRNCFDSIPSDGLMRQVRQRVFHPAILRLIEGMLQAHIWNALPGQPAKAGVSQGSALAPMLCNIYLHPFDEAMTQQGHALVRYADDWVILCRRRPDAEAALLAATAQLQQLRLEIRADKTGIVHFDRGFAFLGHTFVRNLLVAPGHAPALKAASRATKSHHPPKPAQRGR